MSYIVNDEELNYNNLNIYLGMIEEKLVERLEKK
jgi:hypothetical protein